MNEKKQLELNKVLKHYVQLLSKIWALGQSAPLAAPSFLGIMFDCSAYGFH